MLQQQQLWRTGLVQKKLLTGSRRGVNGTRLAVGVARAYVADTRYLSIVLSAEEGKNEPTF